MRWLWSLMSVVALLLGGGLVSGCGGSGPTNTADPALGSLLSDIPSNADTRTRILINNLRALRQDAGLPADLKYRDLFPNSQYQSEQRDFVKLQNALHQLGDGTPLGSQLLSGTGVVAPYEPMGITGELAVGGQGHMLSVVDVPFNATAVGKALTSYGWSPRKTDGATAYAGPENASNRLSPILNGNLTEIAFASGNRLVGVGGDVPADEVANVIQRRATHRSLADDPQVATTLRLLGPSESLAMGTELVSPISDIAGGITSQARAQIAHRLGIEALPSPSFCGYARLPDRSWRAVALYASEPDASRAAKIITNVLRNGTDPQANAPYSSIVHELGVKVEGKGVVVKLASSPHVPQMIDNRSFPLFWSPSAS